MLEYHWQSPCSFELISRISNHPTVFFSHNKPANSTFSHNKPAKRTGWITELSQGEDKTGHNCSDTVIQTRPNKGHHTRNLLEYFHQQECKIVCDVRRNMQTVFINKKYASAAKLYRGNSPNMNCPSLPQDIILFRCGPAAASSTEDGKQLCQTIYNTPSEQLAL
jgi:hypothetical protein